VTNAPRDDGESIPSAAKTIEKETKRINIRMISIEKITNQ